MEELGLDPEHSTGWFSIASTEPYVLAVVREDAVASWCDMLGPGIRRCYATDEFITARSRATGRPVEEVLRAKLPNAGSTMAGDFGEILSYIYLAEEALPQRAVGPKKWRLKQDRTKPAPGSDVIHFIIPDWPLASANDVLLCAEVKTKSTRGESVPIQSAIADCAKDRTSRLARTLTWLKERAICDGLGAITIDHLDRFIQAVDHAPCEKRFHAVAVICSTLLEEEIETAPAHPDPSYRLVVISVPQLKDAYTSAYQRAFGPVDESTSAPAPDLTP